MAAGVVGYGAIAATLLVSALGDWRAQPGSRSAYAAFVGALMFLLLFVLAIRIVHGEFAKVTRGLVSVTSGGIAVRDSRGRERSLLWPEVEELRVSPCLGLDTLDIRGADRRLRVEFGLHCYRDLRDLIIRRAYLTQETRRWWGTLYTRPSV
jgi:hypothetical protein